MSLPLIDFSCYGLNVDDTSSASSQDVEKLAEEVHDALSTWGFMYLSGHGVADDEVSKVNRLNANFFQLPNEFKSKYASYTGKFKAIHGWSALAREILDTDKPSDLKESFDAQPYLHDEDAEIWPDHQAIPNYKEISMNFYNRCHQLALRILDVIAIGLNLEDKGFFSKCHKNMSYGGNYTDLRSIYYPPILSEVQPGQQRCAEHTDYGSLTILFQDDIGGLEVFCKKTEEYISAKPIPGCVLVNIGDLMERWTANQLVATKHRVVVPKEEKLMVRARQSIAFFVHPNKDTVVVPLDGSSKRSPVLSGVWAERRFNQSYDVKESD